MHYLDLTLPRPEENLALDEVLLDEAERSGVATETLRIWEPGEAVVVVGRSSVVDDEVRVEACRRARVPILRRASGGAAVLAGPGCLMYAVVLSTRRRPEVARVDRAHRFVLGALAAALGRFVPGIACQGTSDLAIAGRKFSGNSLRCRRGHLLYHGTLLYHFPLDRIGEFLKMPSRQPAYRQGRDHDQFVTNLPLTADAIREALRRAFSADAPLGAWPQERTSALVAEKYARPSWNAVGSGQ
jgi:lipoate---protein ligase